MGEPRHTDSTQEQQRKAAVRGALLLAAVVIAIYVWSIASHL